MGSPASSSARQWRVEMLSKDQFLGFFEEFSRFIELPETKQRIVKEVKSGKEAGAVTSKILGEIFEQIGIEANFGLTCLKTIKAVCKGDRNLTVKFLEFQAREELGRAEAQLGAQEFQLKLLQESKRKDQLLDVLQKLRTSSVDHQRAIFRRVRELTATNSVVSGQSILEMLAHEQQKLQSSAPTVSKNV